MILNYPETGVSLCRHRLHEDNREEDSYRGRGQEAGLERAAASGHHRRRFPEARQTDARLLRRLRLHNPKGPGHRLACEDRSSVLGGVEYHDDDLCEVGGPRYRCCLPPIVKRPRPVISARVVKARECVVSVDFDATHCVRGAVYGRNVGGRWRAIQVLPQAWYFATCPRITKERAALVATGTGRRGAQRRLPSRDVGPGPLGHAHCGVCQSTRARAEC
jgi:hypothetical protein